MASKRVRFYRPQLLARNGKELPVKPGFWTDLEARVAAMDDKNREMRFNQALYYGESGIGKQRALPYFRVGRIRLRADWPDVIRDDYDVRPLTIRGGNLFEASYMMPFGTRSQVAVMGPLSGGRVVSPQALEHWLTMVSGVMRRGESLKLVPEVDPLLRRKLNDSVGVSKVTIQLPYSAALNAPLNGNDIVDRAVAAAGEAGGEELDVTVTLSHGHRTPRAKKSGALRGLVERLDQGGGYSSVDFSLMLPVDDGERFRIEHHDLVNDTVATKAEFEVPDDERLGVDQVLEGIYGAVQEFQRTTSA